MELNTLLSYMYDYGFVFLSIIIFLEYLNLPGFPAGVILPLSGIWASKTDTSFWLVLAVSVAVALTASWLLYLVGWYSGDFVLTKLFSKFPKQQETVEKQLSYLRQKGNIGVFISKLLPMVRTIISIPAGILKLDFWRYTISSALGIAVWNGVFIASGYFFGQEVFNRIL